MQLPFPLKKIKIKYATLATEGLFKGQRIKEATSKNAMRGKKKPKHCTSTWAHRPPQWKMAEAAAWTGKPLSADRTGWTELNNRAENLFEVAQGSRSRRTVHLPAGRRPCLCNSGYTIQRFRSKTRSCIRRTRSKSGATIDCRSQAVQPGWAGAIFVKEV